MAKSKDERYNTCEELIAAVQSVPEQVTIPNAGEAFDASDELKDARAAAHLLSRGAIRRKVRSRAGATHSFHRSSDPGALFGSL